MGNGRLEEHRKGKIRRILERTNKRNIRKDRLGDYQKGQTRGK